MPLAKYGVLKGKVVGIEDEISERNDNKSPHVKIKIKCENNNKKYEVVVNARSNLRPYEVLYVSDENYKSATFEYIPKLKEGFTLIKLNNKFVDKTEFIHNIDKRKFDSEIEYTEFLNKINNTQNFLEEISVDFVRKEVFNVCDMKIVPHNLVGKDNDLFDFIISHTAKAIVKDANIYVYGEPFSSTGMHNIHMNQGNSKKFKEDNGIYQDGCIFLEFKDHWEAIFIAFQSQSWYTNENGDVKPGKECYLYDHNTSQPTGRCKEVNINRNHYK